jgi:hypothetical protein
MRLSIFLLFAGKHLKKEVKIKLRRIDENMKKFPYSKPKNDEKAMKKAAVENIETFKANNHALTQLIAIVCNNCEEAMNQFNPDLITQMRASVRYLDDMNEFLSRLQRI